MWQILPVNTVSALFVAVVGSLAIAGFVTFAGRPPRRPSGTFWRLLRSWITTGSTIFGSLALLGSFDGVVGYVWRMPLLGPYLEAHYPYLGGEWIAEVTSNRSVGQSGHLSDPARYKVRVRCNLYRILVEFGDESAYARSQTVFAIPEIDAASGRQYLWYIYRGEVMQPRDTDERFHLGAGHLEVIALAPLTLVGTYWTDRGWMKGLNTAGRITLRRN
jgi:hypothetical protein